MDLLNVYTVKHKQQHKVRILLIEFINFLDDFEVRFIYFAAVKCNQI